MLSILMAGAVALTSATLDQVLDEGLAVAAYQRRVDSMPKYQEIGRGAHHACSIFRAARDASFELKELRLKRQVYVMDEALGGPGAYDLTDDDLQRLDLRILQMERDAAYYAGLCR